MLVLHRPAKIQSDMARLDDEFRSARWLYHRLLDFEDEHQRELDRVASDVAPGILAVGRILARLGKRAKRAKHTRTGTWAPSLRPELAARLRIRLVDLRDQRNGSSRWKAAISWADDQTGEPKALRRRKAKHPNKVVRRKTETDEAFAKRFELLTNDETEEHFAEKVAKAPRESRRDVYRKQLYAQRRCYWGTWNGLLKSVELARKSVLERRRQGLPAEWRRPRWDEGGSIYAEGGGFRVVEFGSPWWVVEMRLGVAEEWVRFRAKLGNCAKIPADADLRTAQLTRKRDGERWAYSVSITVDAQKSLTPYAESGRVAFDWGHREHGHANAHRGMRVFTWLGDDGANGEVLLPKRCRELLDRIDENKSRMDTVFNARKSSIGIAEKNRYTYRRRLMRSGVKSEEETSWLAWEMRYERRLMADRKHLINIRKETYLQAVIALRKRYKTFVFEAESNRSLKQKAIDEEMERRKRSNRDLSARFEFVTICERFGAVIDTVSARNTTRECPDCGHLDENTAELHVACSGCGRVRDKDFGAVRVILKRAMEALAA